METGIVNPVAVPRLLAACQAVGRALGARRLGVIA